MYMLSPSRRNCIIQLLPLYYLYQSLENVLQQHKIKYDVKYNQPKL